MAIVNDGGFNSSTFGNPDIQIDPTSQLEFDRLSNQCATILSFLRTELARPELAHSIRYAMADVSTVGSIRLLELQKFNTASLWQERKLREDKEDDWLSSLDVAKQEECRRVATMTRHLILQRATEMDNSRDIDSYGTSLNGQMTPAPQHIITVAAEMEFICDYLLSEH